MYVRNAWGLAAVLSVAVLLCALGCARVSDPLAQAQTRKIVTSKSEISTGFGYIQQVAWSPDSKYFAVTQATRTKMTIEVYDAITNKIVKSLQPKISSSYTGDRDIIMAGDVSFSPDGRYLAGGYGVITLWDTQTWQPVRDILGPFARGMNVASGVRSIAFSPDSRSLAILYPSVIWPESIRVNGFEEVVAFARKRKIDKSITDEAAIMVFDVETTNRNFFVKEKQTASDGERFSRLYSGGISYSPDGKFIIANHVGSIRHDLLTKEDDRSKHFTHLIFLDAKTGKLAGEISDVHVMEISASTFSHDGNIVATGTNTGAKKSSRNTFTDQWTFNNNADPIRVWDAVSGKKLLELGPIRGAVRRFAFSPDDKVLVSCQTDISENETVWLWDLTSGQLIERISTPRHGTDFSSCALSPDGRTLAMPVMGKIYLIHIKQ